MVLILGAGLAGLSAAHHLQGRDRLVLERHDEVGGLCRSIREDGFTFDLTGHLLHLRDPEIRAWVGALMPDAFADLSRSAWIHSHGVLTPYPFQANTAGLPLSVRMECLLGFIETLKHGDAGAGAEADASKAAGTNGSGASVSAVPDPVPLSGGPEFLGTAPEPAPDEPSFLTWIHRTFGAGFAKHFFEPYNRKLWRRDLSEVTGDWVSWSIPRPDLGDVLRGAVTGSEKAFGYNPEFLYPAAGGIDHLPQAVAASLEDGVVRTGCDVVALEAGARRVTLGDGETHDAETILTSLPLPALARLTTDLPEALRAAAAELSHVSVRAVNLGVKGPPPHPDAQWIYFPEEALPFHRIGLPTALTPAMAPAGHHSLVAEIAFRPDEDRGAEASLDATLAGLVSTGLLASPHDVVHARVVDIPEAYVVFDAARRRVLPQLFRWFLDHEVLPLGRYGAWDYLSMEDCLRHGKQAAEWIAGRAR